jgi:hypothetical protein
MDQFHCGHDTSGNRRPAGTNDAVPPPIPVRLAHRPTLGGLVVPFVSPRTHDGRYLLGGVDAYDRSSA